MNPRLLPAAVAASTLAFATACSGPADAHTPPPPTDRAPVVTAFAVSASSIGPGQAVDVSAAAEDPDGDAVTLAWSATCAGAASGGFADSAAGATRWTAAAGSGAGTCTLAVEAAANGLSARRTADVAVVPPTDRAPVITAFAASASSVAPGQAVDVSATASDPDGDAVALAWSASCTGAATGSFADPAAAATRWTAAAGSGAGTCTLAVDATANGKTARRTADVTVVPPVDRAPVITAFAVSASSVAPGQAVDVSATAEDPDGDAVTLAWSASCTGAATGSFVDPAAAATRWIAAPGSGAGTCTLAVDATANGKSARRTADVTVVPPTDRPPVITAFAVSASSVAAGQFVDVSATAEDPDGDAVTLAWSASCTGAASGSFADPASATTRWTAAAGSGAGTCTVAVDATANGKTARRTADVTVVPAAGPTLAEALQTLAGRKTFFGHQSVGGQLLSAIGSLATANGVTLLRAWAPTFDRPMLGDYGVGRNYDAASKIADFETNLMPAYGSKAQYAFFKFCFTDFQVSVVPADVLAAYRASLARLRAAYPAVTFVHVTVPLCQAATDPTGGVRRQTYNALLRQAYAGTEPLFDLARLESTAPDGTRVTYTAGGQENEALAPAYASADGCHLSSPAAPGGGGTDGAARMAEALVRFLAALP